MAALSVSERARAARIVAGKIFNGGGPVANMNHDDLNAAVGAVDDAFEGLPTALPNQGQSVALNINAILPDPFKTLATVPMKSILVGVWAGVKYGVL